ncbi:fatty acid desaturase [Micromonospora sp. ALFpr18c]|uniref:fatty acid desaturase family protein n=1 Tax=Micromonospora sp. ALFpr18c TaxID=1458665 RepID=UPI00124B8C74|nr:fatty acid desaturase [Micromonospora sp. ALFpr18c]KAB1931833.1 fatty acid desaturase [Micromonospora sp. ALFpr18c]
MSQTAISPRLLFQRATVRPRDEAVFIVKLLVLAVLTAAGAWCALQPTVAVTVAGVVLLGLAYTHAVELQHQCLHHSAFRRSRLHRIVGVPLGLPLMVAYSHYRVRHLQHHRALGTPDDTEFFGFDTRQPLTAGTLVRGFIDLRRLAAVARDTAQCVAGRWEYDMGQISPRSRKAIVTEYRLFAAAAVLLLVACALGGGEWVLRLWLLPLVVAMPMHFLVELPEHILCDTESIDVLRNTRSITGSPLTTWFTNGNNLHIEHHAAMNVPINRLRERHGEARELGLHVQRTYADFFLIVAREIWRNRDRSRA